MAAMVNWRRKSCKPSRSIVGMGSRHKLVCGQKLASSCSGRINLAGTACNPDSANACTLVTSSPASCFASVPTGAITIPFLLWVAIAKPPCKVVAITVHASTMLECEHSLHSWRAWRHRVAALRISVRALCHERAGWKSHPQKLQQEPQKAVFPKFKQHGQA